MGRDTPHKSRTERLKRTTRKVVSWSKTVSCKGSLGRIRTVRIDETMANGSGKKKRGGKVGCSGTDGRGSGGAGGGSVDGTGTDERESGGVAADRGSGTGSAMLGGVEGVLGDPGTDGSKSGGVKRRSHVEVAAQVEVAVPKRKRVAGTYKDADCGRKGCDALRKLLGGNARSGATQQMRSGTPLSALSGRKRLEMEEIEAAGIKLLVSQEVDPNMWFATGHRPSAADCREQLKALRRSQVPGTLEQAKVKMAKAVNKVTAAGVKWQNQQLSSRPGFQVAKLDFSHLVEDGQHSEEWQLRVENGEAPPPPFEVSGKFGRLAAFSLSAVREVLVGRQASRLSSHATEVAAMASTQLGEVPPVTIAESQTLSDGAVGFVEGMRPSGDAGLETPTWIRKLLDGDLLCGVNFWE